MQLMLTIMEAVRNMVAKIPRSAGCVKDWGWRLSGGVRGGYTGYDGKAFTMTVRRLNHAVLRVREIERSLAFYADCSVSRRSRGLETLWRSCELRDRRTTTISVSRASGQDAPPPNERGVGLYHLAWEVNEIEALREARDKLHRYGTLSGTSDHGATKSIYGYDPDGNEFEIMWLVPREHWAEFEHAAPTRPLDLEAEIARWSTRASRSN